MQDNDLKRLKREELLEMLIEQSKDLEAEQEKSAKLQIKVDELTAQIEELELKLEDKSIQLGSAGSIAEAALALSDIFRAADEAASMYVENVKKLEQEKLTEFDKLKQETLAECDAMRNDTIEFCAGLRKQSEKKRDEANRLVERANSRLAQMRETLNAQIRAFNPIEEIPSADKTAGENAQPAQAGGDSL